MTATNRAAKIAELNDALRRDPASGKHGRIVMTCGVSECGTPPAKTALRRRDELV